ncbi:ricin-type beta-trefoil lectin domain protein [Micromonospora sp. M12]
MVHAELHPGSPPPPVGGTITGVGGKCLDVDNSGTADGTKIQLYTCNGTAAQSWTRVGDTYRVLGKCLDIDNAGTANGTKVQLWTCNGTGAQVWQPQADGSIRNPLSGKILEAAGGHRQRHPDPDRHVRGWRTPEVGGQ